jgi:hypothetical protein
VGRKLNLISLAGALSILVVGQALAQSPGPRRGFFNRPRPQFKNPPPNVQRFQLSPEDRQTFQKNAERWLQMTPEQRKVMREREKMRRERFRTEAETVLRDSGLRLDEKKRDLFQERYLQERQRIDRELRQEYENKRQQQLERLKKEFQPPENSPSVSSTSAPAAASGSPRR